MEGTYAGMVLPLLEVGLLSNHHLVERLSVETGISNYTLVPDQPSRQRKLGEERSGPLDRSVDSLGKNDRSP